MRGQIAKLFSTIPVLFIVVLLIGGFVFYAGFMKSRQTNVSLVSYELGSSLERVATQRLVLQGQQLSFLEAVVREQTEEGFSTAFGDAIERVFLAHVEKPAEGFSCLLLALESTGANGLKSHRLSMSKDNQLARAGSVERVSFSDQGLSWTVNPVPRPVFFTVGEVDYTLYYSEGVCGYA